MRPSYFVALDLLTKSLSFFVVPIYALVLSPAEMGKFSEWFSFYTLLFGISFFGINSFVVVLNSKGLSGPAVEPHFVQFLLKWWLLISPIILFTIIYYSEFNLETIYLTLPIAAASFCVIDYTNIKLRLSNSIKKYAISQLLVLLSLHLIPLLVTAALPSAGARIFAFTFFSLLTSVLMIGIFKEITFKANANLKIKGQKRISSKRIINFGLPLVILAVGQWFKSGFDLQLVKVDVGYDLAGSLGIVLQLSSVVLISSAILNRVYSIELYRLLSEHKTKEWLLLILKLSTTTFIASAGVLLVTLIVLQNLLEAYDFISELATPIIIGSAIYSIACYFSFILFYYEKSTFFTGLQVFSAVIHVPCSIYIINEIGPENIGYSSLISNSLFFAGTLWVSFKIKKLTT